MSNLYIQKSLLRSRDEFSGPDKFFNLTKFVTDIAAAATDEDALEEQINTHIINVPVTPHTTSVAALQTSAFIVPSQMNGMVLKEVRVRHGVASTGATGNTAVQVLKNSTDMITGNLINIPAQALVPAVNPVPNATTVATGDPVFVYVSAIPAGGTAPTGLYATLVFGEA